MKRPIEIDRKHGPPGVERIVPGFHVRAGDPGIVHQDVDALESLDRLVARAFHVRVVGDIDCNRRHTAAAFQFDRRLFCKFDVTIPDRNCRTGIQKPFHDRAADALRTTGDNRVAPTEIDLVGHRRLLNKS